MNKENRKKEEIEIFEKAASMLLCAQKKLNKAMLDFQKLKIHGPRGCDGDSGDGTMSTYEKMESLDHACQKVIQAHALLSSIVKNKTRRS